jgi:16S rRNA processing protein RimM
VKTSSPNLAQDPIASREAPAPEQVPQWVVLAQLLRPQGRKGEILAELFTDFPERFDTRKRVFLAPTGFAGPESATRVAEIAAWWLPVGRNQGRIVLSFSGIVSINEAEALCGLEVIVPAAERVALDDNASYISDLIGCTVIDLADPGHPVSVGLVTDVHFATTPDGGRRLEEAAPLLAVEAGDGDEVLIPFAKAFILLLDPERKRIEMSLPPGLLEVNRPQAH